MRSALLLVREAQRGGQLVTEGHAGTIFGARNQNVGRTVPTDEADPFVGPTGHVNPAGGALDAHGFELRDGIAARRSRQSEAVQHDRAHNHGPRP